MSFLFVELSRVACTLSHPGKYQVPRIGSYGVGCFASHNLPNVTIRLLDDHHGAVGQSPDRLPGLFSNFLQAQLEL